MRTCKPARTARSGRVLDPCMHVYRSRPPISSSNPPRRLAGQSSSCSSNVVVRETLLIGNHFLTTSYSSSCSSVSRVPSSLSYHSVCDHTVRPSWTNVVQQRSFRFPRISHTTSRVLPSRETPVGSRRSTNISPFQALETWLEVCSSLLP